MWAIPPNGWHIEAHGQTITGTTKAELIANLRKYRGDNLLPLSDPAGDVDDFICQRFPNLCGQSTVSAQDPDEPKKVYGQPVRRRLVDRLASWSATRYSKLGALSHVSPEEALRRANICIECPSNNRHWRDEVVRDCPPCRDRVEALQSLLYRLRGGRKVLRENQLGACEASGQCNQTAVWLTDDALQHAKHYELPTICWMRSVTPSGETKSADSPESSSADT